MKFTEFADNPDVVAVKPEADYTLRLKFANGEVKRYDVKPLLDSGVFRALRNRALFNGVRVCHGTVEWPNEADICPDTLYEESVAA